MLGYNSINSQKDQTMNKEQTKLLEQLENNEISTSKFRELFQAAEEKSKSSSRSTKNKVTQYKRLIQELLEEKSFEKIIYVFKVFVDKYPFQIDYSNPQFEQAVQQMFDEQRFEDIVSLVGVLSKRSKFPAHDGVSRTQPLLPTEKAKSKGNPNAHKPYIDELKQLAGVETKSDNEEESDSDDEENMELDDEDLDFSKVENTEEGSAEPQESSTQGQLEEDDDNDDDDDDNLEDF
jgi:hypothetical protein